VLLVVGSAATADEVRRNCPEADSARLFADGFELGSLCAWGDPSPCPARDQMATLRATADGVVAVDVGGVLVTKTTPAVGLDPAGFFVQAEPEGPAIFVAVSPHTLSPVPLAGDAVSFTVTQIGTWYSQRRVLAISAWTVHARGLPIDLAVDRSGAVDLVSNLEQYDGEMTRIRGELLEDPDGASFYRTQLVTEGIDDWQLGVRVEPSLALETDLQAGCEVEICGTPLWRDNTQAFATAWTEQDLAVTSCPPASVELAAAPTSTSVIVQFTHSLDPETLLADGSQFAFDPPLTVTGAAIDSFYDSLDHYVRVTTSEQIYDTTYTVSVASSLLDELGSPIAAPNAAQFNGAITWATVQISEVNANLADGCDLVELTVLHGGSMEGISLRDRLYTLIVFPHFFVGTGDRLVVHLKADSSTCNPDGASSETAGTSEQSAAEYAGNLDGAWDWHVVSPSGDLYEVDNVLVLRDRDIEVSDGILLADGLGSVTTPQSESASNLLYYAGAWLQPDGTLPPAGFFEEIFRDSAVLDLDATGTSRDGTSIQRLGTSDSDRKTDWTMATSSWGTANP
jgi:hypothetical protein